MDERIDEIDRHILDILASDGRVPASQIAERVGLSRPAVAERIERSNVTAFFSAPSASSIRGPGLGITAFIAAQLPTPLDTKGKRAFRELMTGAKCSRFTPWQGTTAT